MGPLSLGLTKFLQKLPALPTIMDDISKRDVHVLRFDGNDVGEEMERAIQLTYYMEHACARDFELAQEDCFEAGWQHGGCAAASLESPNVIWASLPHSGVRAVLCQHAIECEHSLLTRCWKSPNSSKWSSALASMSRFSWKWILPDQMEGERSSDMLRSSNSFWEGTYWLWFN